jgi:DNA-binding NarL/FixJ family response regulator
MVPGVAFSPARAPITVALVDDYDVVLIGLAHMFDQYSDRISVVEIDANEPEHDSVDIVLYDTFAQPEADQDEISVLVDHPRARKAVVYTWNFHPELIASATAKGASGYLSKTLPAHALVAALEAIDAGDVVVSPSPGKTRPDVGLDWPGRSEGLTNRESEILALITQGRNNAEVAALTFLSKNSIKTYIRSAYRKIGVESRTQAVLWGIEHGFRPDHHRIDHWRNGP